VTAGHRLYGLTGQGTRDLAYAYDMAAVGHKLQSHLSAQLKWGQLKRLGGGAGE